MIICHDVVKVTDENNKRIISGASPDEVTFLEMAEDFGYAQFLERTSDKITIKIGDKEEVYQILAREEFTSDRKRMSVMVQNKET